MSSGGLPNISASRSSVFLKCAWFAQPGVRLPDQPDDPKLAPDIPRFGRAFHKTMESWLLSEPVLIDDLADLYAVDKVRLADYFERASKEMTKLFTKRGWMKRERLVEKKLVYDPFSDTARVLAATGERDYGGRKPTEIPGTADLAMPPIRGMPLFLVDWKSGQATYEAETNPQLHTLALGLTRYLKAPRVPIDVAIVRIDDEVIDISEGQIKPESLDRHRLLLRGKLREALSGSAAMRIGSWCKWCDALDQCPAHQSPLAVIEAGSEMITPDMVQHLYPRVVAAEQLLYKLKDRMKKCVEMNGAVDLENGKQLKIIEYNEENLSKATIKRALGNADGEMFIGELRDKGLVETSQVRAMRVVNSK